MKRKVLSYCLWGSSRKYIDGLLLNLDLVTLLYPGWELWCYCDKVALDLLGSQITGATKSKVPIRLILMRESGDWAGMFWRFLPLYDQSVQIFLSRDADSRLSLRERVAVHDWEASGRAFHIMRDHPFHNAKILGGMWGCRVKETLKLGVRFPSVTELKGNHYQMDQEFLATVTYPLVVNHSLTHDPVYEKKEFPTVRVGDEFVGESFDANGNRDLRAVDALNIWLVRNGR